jgi:hypothetical protein
VPKDFTWPLRQVWGGFINPYYQLAGKCPDCEHGNDRARGRADANAALFRAQWYGNAPFDPVAYGAKTLPLTQEHPAYLLAVRNVERAPDFHRSSLEQARLAEFKSQAMAGFPSNEKPLILFPSWDKQAAIDREAQRLYDLWRWQWSHHLVQADVDALVAADRLWDFTRVPINDKQREDMRKKREAGENSWLPYDNGYRPTADEVNLWSYDSFGHDGMNAYVCVRARCEREGVPFLCARCAGNGTIWPSPEIEEQCENWKKTDPPTGDGYQLWEDCSEGSPVSPVFASLDELCEWAADHATTFGPYKATAEEWREMLDDGFVHAKDARGNIFV